MKFDPFEYTRKQFPFLQVKDVVVLLKKSKVIKLKAGDIFIKSGENTTHTAFIIKGLLRSYRITEDGYEKTVLFRKEFELIGSPQSMILAEPAVEEVEALENSWIFVFDFQNFRQLANKNVRIASSLSENLHFRALLSAFAFELIERRATARKSINFWLNIY